MRSEEEEKGALALPLAITTAGQPLVAGERCRCCLGWEVLGCWSACSSASITALACGLRASLAHLRQLLAMLVMGWFCLSLFANPRAAAHPSAEKSGTSCASLGHSTGSC